MATPAPDKESSIDIGIGENLPGVCIVCGTPTSSFQTIEYERPSSLLETVFRIAGSLLIRHLPEENQQTYLLKLPVCGVHAYVDPHGEHLRFVPHRGRSVLVSPVAPEFALALRSAREAQATQLAQKYGEAQPQDLREFFKSLGEQ